MVTRHAGIFDPKDKMPAPSSHAVSVAFFFFFSVIRYPNRSSVRNKRFVLTYCS